MPNVIADIARETSVSGALLKRSAVVAATAAAALLGATLQVLASSEPAQNHSELTRPMTRAEAATAADVKDLVSPIIRMRPLDIRALDATAFGDWDASAQAVTGIEARQR